MTIWIDGPLGAGKTTVAQEVRERFSDSESDFLDSDIYFTEMLKEIIEAAAKRFEFPSIRGTLP